MAGAEEVLVDSRAGASARLAPALLIALAAAAALSSLNYFLRPLHPDVAGSVSRALISHEAGPGLLFREHRPLSYSLFTQTLLQPFMAAGLGSVRALGFALRAVILIMIGCAAFTTSRLSPRADGESRLVVGLFTVTALASASSWMAGQPEYMAAVLALIAAALVVERNGFAIVVGVVLLAGAALLKVTSLAVTASVLTVLWVERPALRVRLAAVGAAALIIFAAVLALEQRAVHEFSFLVLSTLCQHNADLSLPDRLGKFIASFGGVWSHMPALIAVVVVVLGAVLNPRRGGSPWRLIGLVAALALAALPSLAQGTTFTYQLAGLLAPAIIVTIVLLPSAALTRGGLIACLAAALIATALTAVVALKVNQPDALPYKHFILVPPLAVGLGFVGAIAVLLRLGGASAALAGLGVVACLTGLVVDPAFHPTYGRQAIVERRETAAMRAATGWNGTGAPPHVLFLSSAAGPRIFTAVSACYFIYPVPLQRAADTSLRVKLEKQPGYQSLHACALSSGGAYLLWEPTWFTAKGLQDVGLAGVLDGRPLLMKDERFVLYGPAPAR
jgi:hypothetical protein